jgi:hypothetical protein
MISKVITGKSFGGVCRYLCEDISRALVLDVSGVRNYHHKLMAADFEQQSQLNPNLKQPVFHAILSYYPGEQVTNEKMILIAKEYLEQLGIKNTQYVVVKHTDRKHPHVHIVANRVDNDGKTIKDNWLGLRGKKVAQHLTQKHELVQAQKKNLSLTNIERLSEHEANRYNIYEAISKHLPRCKNLVELEQKLTRQGIETLYKYKGQTKELQGVSFQIGKYKYKGSEIDRQFSIKNLEKTLLLNQTLRPGHYEQLSIKESRQKAAALMSQMQQSKGESLLEQLLRHEHAERQVPYELIKKKKKQRGHHL